MGELYSEVCRLFDGYALIKKELAGALAPLGAVEPGDMRICERGYEVRAVCRRLSISAGEARAVLEGCPYVGRVLDEGGCLLIGLSGAYYDMALGRVSEAPLPELPDDVGGIVPSALARSLTLCELPGESCPDDAEVRRLLWLAMGIPGFLDDTKRLSVRLRTVSQLTLALGAGRSISERGALFHACGGVMGAVARLVFCGMNMEEI